MSNYGKLSILGHLRELRTRLIRSVIAITITTVISFVFAKSIFNILLIPAKGINLIYIDLTEMLGVYMKVALASGIILAIPYLIYELIMFVMPALTRKEKRYVYIILPWVALMFTGGVAFGYFVLLPPAIRILLTFGNDIATPQIRIGNYIGTITRLLLAIGFVFELPVISTFLARLGIITSSWMAKMRKPWIIIAFIIGATITPTLDPVNQSLVAVPLIILYEMSIWLAKFVQPKRYHSIASAPASLP